MKGVLTTSGFRRVRSLVLSLSIGAKIVFYDGGDFRANIGNGTGGAVLNFGRLVFKVDEGDSYTLNFKDNYCGDHEVGIEGNRRTSL